MAEIVGGFLLIMLLIAVTGVVAIVVLGAVAFIVATVRSVIEGRKDARRRE